MVGGRKLGGRAFKQQLVLFTCLAVSILFLPAHQEENQRCYQTVLFFFNSPDSPVSPDSPDSPISP